MVPGNWRRWELTSIRDLARTANWFVIQVAWRFARRSGSTLFIPYPWARRVKQTGRRRRERSRTRLGDTGEEVAAWGSKKERDVCLTRDLPRTINCGGAEIIQDFVAVTCDANKSFVPITYALINFRSRRIWRRASVRRDKKIVESIHEQSIHDCRLSSLIRECLGIIIILSAIFTSLFNYLFARDNSKFDGRWYFTAR